MRGPDSFESSLDFTNPFEKEPVFVYTTDLLDRTKPAGSKEAIIFSTNPTDEAPRFETIYNLYVEDCNQNGREALSMEEVSMNSIREEVKEDGELAA